MSLKQILERVWDIKLFFVVINCLKRKLENHFFQSFHPFVHITAPPAEAYSEPCQTSKIKLFAKIVTCVGVSY